VRAREIEDVGEEVKVEPGVGSAAAAASTRQVADAELPTQWGNFRALGFERHVGGRVETAIVLIMGDISGHVPLVRIHSECLTGDVFGSQRCDCGEQLEVAMKAISTEKTGILIYEKQEGRGIGLMAKLQAYQLQDGGLDTVEANHHLGLAADYRDFVLPAEILTHLGVEKVRLLTNNPQKVTAVRNAGIEVVERIACEVPPSRHARSYLKTKKLKMGHVLTLV
jgi:GTP cyclohydrolase II